MIRRNEAELLDATDVPDELVHRAYRDIAAIHYWLGDVRFMTRAIRRDRLPVRRILDVGCATCLISHWVGRNLGVVVVGADIQPRPAANAPIPIWRADARFDPLPVADVAFSMHLGHHLAEDDVVRLIRNVGRYCRRFILLDLVRHPLPLALFRLFLAPLICGIDAEDGQRSIRRSYTPGEWREIAATALADSGGTFQLTVAPFYIRQVVDVAYGDLDSVPVPECAGEAFAERGR